MLSLLIVFDKDNFNTPGGIFYRYDSLNAQGGTPYFPAPVSALEYIRTSRGVGKKSSRRVKIFLPPPPGTHYTTPGPILEGGGVKLCQDWLLAALGKIFGGTNRVGYEYDKVNFYSIDSCFCVCL